MDLRQWDFRGCVLEELPDAAVAALEEAARRGRQRAVTMTAVADSGHPAGSLSSMEMYLLTYGTARLTPENAPSSDRDHVVVSHGHTSPGAYAALAAWGFVDGLDAEAHFRDCGSPFSGHVERGLPGVDWSSGNLGQGLAAGVGYALAARARGNGAHTIVLMGDGGQTKGQSAEARRIAHKEGLGNLTALVDYNGIQISGATGDVMPADLEALWKADGWRVLFCDGHDFRDLYRALREAWHDDKPTVVFCRTVMGKGVSFMEGKADYHGKAPSGELYAQAMRDLGGDPDRLAAAKKRRGSELLPQMCRVRPCLPEMDLGEPKTYDPATKTDCRSAFGEALADVGRRNYGVPGRTPLLVFDCDLAESVKTGTFAKACPDWFIQAGIQEHAVATAAGAASVGGVGALWADFGVFGLSEVYNQQRLNDINETNLKIVLTHVGLDVGEDGMTHQCIDYVGLLRNTFGWKLVVPADPNQTDRALRYALGSWGNLALAMGRSKLPVITREDGTPFFAGDYRFVYGAADVVREGGDVTIVCLGAMLWRGLEARELLAARGISARVVSVSCPLALGDGDLREMASPGALVTYEDHHVGTGLGAVVTSRMARLGLSCQVATLGVHQYGCSAAAEKVYATMGLTSEDVVETVERLLGRR